MGIQRPHGNNILCKLIMITLSIGNKFTTVSTKQHLLKRQTTIKFEPHCKVIIGLDRSIKHVIYDFITLLGLKYQDEQFSRFAKFYAYDFNKNKWGKIEIVTSTIEDGILRNKRYPVQTILALYLITLLNQFRTKFYSTQYTNLKNFIKANRFVLNLSGVADHSTRFALKQVCEIAGIQLPVLINGPHSAICAFYAKYRQKLQQSQQVCILEFGDKGSTASVYKMHMFQDKIIEVIEHRSLKKGGYHLTKVLASYVVDKIKEEKGIDINRHSSYMGALHSQCQNTKIGIIQSQQNEGHIRVADLPDDSTFGITVTLKTLMQVLQQSILEMVNFCEETFKKYPSVKQILVMGGCSKIPLLRQKIQQLIDKQKKVTYFDASLAQNGNFYMQEQQIVLFDVSDALYEVVGEEGFERRLMQQNQNIPERRSEKTKFPAGQLQFNLRVSQNGVKIAHFLLESRPSQSEFLLNFQIDRNKLIWLYAKTDKGKIDLIPNFEAMTAEQILLQIKTIKDFQQ